MSDSTNSGENYKVKQKQVKKQDNNQTYLKQNHDEEVKNHEPVVKNIPGLHFLEKVIDNVTLPFLVLDTNLNILKANRPFYNVFDLTPNETEGKLVYNLKNSAWNNHSIQHLLQEVLPLKGKVSNYPVIQALSDDYEHTMLLNAEKIATDNAAEDLIILSFRDITSTRKGYEANAMLAAIVESSEDAIVSKTLEGIITSWNKSAEKLFGYTREEMIGEPILKVIPDERIKEEPEIIRKIRHGETIAHFETQRMAKDGRLIDISLTISPIKDNSGNIIGASKIARDITSQIESRKKIEESEMRFHNLIYSSPSAIGILDGPDFVIRIANEPIIEVFGKGNDVIGKSIFNILPELQTQGYRKIFEKVFNTGVPYTAVERPLGIVKDGHPVLRYYNFILYPQKNAQNKIDGIGIIASDVTAQALNNKKIKESEERFRSLTQTLPQLIFVTNVEGETEFASSRWKEYSGLEPLAKGTWEAMVHPDDLTSITNWWHKSLATGDVYKTEVRLRNKDGEYRWHAVMAEPVLSTDYVILKWVGAFTDINEQKLKEEKKDEFMGIASHEMKTPLTTAKAYLQMLELSLNDTQTEARLFALKANQSVNRLNGLISELLDVSKIQFGKLNYNMTMFNFDEMIENTIETIRLTSPNSKIIKTGITAGNIEGDKERLQQVLINLLSNAIKYSPNSNDVLLNIEENEQNILVSVQDYGIGIAPENLNKIFDKYHRVEEQSVQFQGMGVGLFISYEIIQRHHGELWVESEIGKGSTFIFTLPKNT